MWLAGAGRYPAVGPVPGRPPATARDDAGVRQVAQSFEALLLEMLLRQMRRAVADSGGVAGDTYREWLDRELAARLAARGVGLADHLYRHLTLRYNGFKTEGGAAVAEPGSDQGNHPAPGTAAAGR